MDEFLVVFWIFLALGFLFTMSGLRANNKVYRCRIAMLDEILFATHVDAARYDEYEWRYREFDKVNYHAQVWLLALQPWKDPRDFWEDKGFLDPAVRRGQTTY